MKSSARATESTYSLAQRLGESVAREKLIRMLQSTLRSYPKARLWKRKGAYGASLDDSTYLRVSYSYHLTAEQQRDLLALLATWLVADPDRLLKANTPQGG